MNCKLAVAVITKIAMTKNVEFILDWSVNLWKFRVYF